MKTVRQKVNQLAVKRNDDDLVIENSSDELKEMASGRPGARNEQEPSLKALTNENS